MLQWPGRWCVFCPMELRPLSEADTLPLSRRGLVPQHDRMDRHSSQSLLWTCEVQSCSTSLCCLWDVVLSQFSRAWPNAQPSRMELAGQLEDFLCLQTGFTAVAFSIDFLRYFECLLMHNRVSYEGFLRSYAAFWKCDALATQNITGLFTRAHLLFALVDFLQRPGRPGNMQFWKQNFKCSQIASLPQLWIYLYLSIYLSISLCIYVSMYLSIYLTNYLTI